MSQLDAMYLRRRLRQSPFFNVAVRNARAEFAGPTEFSVKAPNELQALRDHEKTVLARIQWSQAAHDLAGLDFDDEDGWAA